MIPFRNCLIFPWFSDKKEITIEYYLKRGYFNIHHFSISISGNRNEEIHKCLSFAKYQKI